MLNHELKSISVGLIATGDELTQGDILNTNGQEIVLALNELGLTTAEHFIVSDEEERIRAAITYFRARHSLIILTGGLGPTSDDRTRYALANALQRELQLDEAAWQQLQDRLTRLNLPITAENREQALIPEGGKILPNPAGTAAGCYLHDQGIEYFMLPGPPSECLPMFKNYVLPMLTQFKQNTYQFKWLLLGANEGKIAAELDAALNDLPCRTGYRWHYPYLDYKVFAASAMDLAEAKKRCLPIVNDYFVSENQTTTVDLLTALLTEQQLTLGFADNPLTQLIKFNLLNAATYSSLSNDNPKIMIKLLGFPEYWTLCSLPRLSEITLSFTSTEKNIRKTVTFYYGDAQVIHYLTAIVAKEIIAFNA